MWKQVINYLIVMIIFGALVCVGKINRKELGTLNDLPQEKSSEHSQKDEYIPLNSITLNLFYNKNDSQNQLDSNARNRWVKPKKRSKYKLKAQVQSNHTNKNESLASSVNSISRENNTFSNTKVCFVSITCNISFHFFNYNYEIGMPTTNQYLCL